MEGYEDYLATSIIKEKEYKRGFENGYKKKEQELRIKEEKELDEMYEDSLKEEKVMSPKDESGFYSDHE